MLADAPIAYWRLGETSGTTAADATGNGRTGTYVGGVALGAAGAIAGDSNAAARFDGVDDSVNVPGHDVFRLNDSWSIEFWARQNTFANTWPGIIRKGDGTDDDGFVIWASASGDLTFMRDNKAVATTGPGALTSAFRHFVITYVHGTDTARWYVDGVLVATHSVNYSNAEGAIALELGRGNDFGNNDLDEVALYATALSAAQIAAHYDAGT